MLRLFFCLLLSQLKSDKYPSIKIITLSLNRNIIKTDGMKHPIIQ